METWRPVPGYEGLYEVSDHGSVRSHARGPARLLNPGVSSSGYPTVSLGRGNTRTVHSLVAEAFIGPKPAGEELRHLNGDKTDPHLVNLRYGTRSENNYDTSRHDRRRIPRHIVDAVRASKGALSLSEAASRYGVSQSHVHNIWTGAQRQHG